MGWMDGIGFSPLATAAELKTALSSSNPPVVLDVRTPAEWGRGHLKGAIHIPVDDLRVKWQVSSGGGSSSSSSNSKSSGSSSSSSNNSERGAHPACPLYSVNHNVLREVSPFNPAFTHFSALDLLLLFPSGCRDGNMPLLVAATITTTIIIIIIIIIRRQTLPTDRPVFIHCKGGQRAHIALRVLANSGYPSMDKVKNVTGGWMAIMAEGPGAFDVEK